MKLNHQTERKVVRQRRKIKMPVNAGGAIQGDMLSGIEEESDVYEAFAPHVDCTNIPLSTESSPGESRSPLLSLTGIINRMTCRLSVTCPRLVNKWKLLLFSQTFTN